MWDRNWTDRAAIKLWLEVLKEIGYDEVIEGEAKGADIMAREEAEKLGFKILNRDEHTRGFPAQWDKYGRAAGPIRNRKMLDQQPQLVVAFHNDIEHSKGTADCIKEAKRRGIVTILKGG